jgi:hypothetical protein
VPSFRGLTLARVSFDATIGWRGHVLLGFSFNLLRMRIGGRRIGHDPINSKGVRPGQRLTLSGLSVLGSEVGTLDMVPRVKQRGFYVQFVRGGGVRRRVGGVTAPAALENVAELQ